MKLSPSVRRRILPVGAVLAPVVMLQMIRSVLSAGPVPAATGTYVPPTASVDVTVHKAAPKPSPEQAKALEWLKTSTARASMRCPMDHFRPAAIVVEPTTPSQVTVSTPTGPTTVEPLPLPRVSLTTILNRPDGALAAINGKIYRIGDEVVPGWKLTAISRDDWTVTLTCDDGRTAEIGSLRKR